MSPKCSLTTTCSISLQFSFVFDRMDVIGIVLAELVEHDVHVMLRGVSLVFQVFVDDPV